jgi:hypothetical protein
MCIQFAKSEGKCDFFSPLINMVGNGLVIGGLGIGSALIVAIALKALGYSGFAIAIGTALPIIAGTVGLATAATGALVIAGLVYALFSAMTSR